MGYRVRERKEKQQKNPPPLSPAGRAVSECKGGALSTAGADGGNAS